MEISSIFQQLQNIDWKAVQKNLNYMTDVFPEEIKSTTCHLADYSWFLSRDMGFSELLEIHQLVMKKNIEIADSKLFDWWHENYKSIAQRIVSRFPTRREPLTEALWAHENGYFTLAIPVFLIQSEGICQDIFHDKLFSTIKGVPRIHMKLINRKRGIISAAFQHTFTLPAAISAGPEHRHKYPNAINRHEIIHGISNDYGTMKNSLKAISLLCFCADVLPPRTND